MFRPGKKLQRLIVTLVVGPPLLWGGILVLMPTEWARAKIVRQLEGETGQHVRLGQVHLRPFGGVRLDNLELAVANSSDLPWLKIKTMVVDVSVRDLLNGEICASHAELAGVALRVHRDASGKFEFEDLFESRKKPKQGTASLENKETSLALSYQFEDAGLTVIDDMTTTRLEFSRLIGNGSLGNGVVVLDTMSGHFNGGLIEMAARVDLASRKLAFESEIHLERVELGVGMKSLRYAIPLLAQAGENTSAEGTLTMQLFLKARGETSDTLAKSLAGQGEMLLDDLTLDHSRLLAEVARHLPVQPHAKIGSLRGGFRVANRRISTSDTVLQIADLPVNLSGWSDFDGHLDYLVRCEHLVKKVQSLAEKLPLEARELLEDLPIERLDSLVNLEVAGTIDRPIVQARESALFSKRHKPTNETAAHRDDRAKLREAGKRFLDRLVR